MRCELCFQAPSDAEDEGEKDEGDFELRPYNLVAEDERQRRVIYVHRVCADWTPDMYYDADDDLTPRREGLRPVLDALARTCEACGQPGGGIECASCHAPSFHYTCAQKAGCELKINTSRLRPQCSYNLRCPACVAKRPASSPARGKGKGKAKVRGTFVAPASPHAAKRPRLDVPLNVTRGVTDVVLREALSYSSWSNTLRSGDGWTISPARAAAWFARGTASNTYVPMRTKHGRALFSCLDSAGDKALIDILAARASNNDAHFMLVLDPAGRLWTASDAHPPSQKVVDDVCVDLERG